VAPHALQQHVPTARRDQGLASQHLFAVAGFGHAHGAQAVQAFGEFGRELHGHVLHDHWCPGRRAARP